MRSHCPADESATGSYMMPGCPGNRLSLMHPTNLRVLAAISVISSVSVTAARAADLQIDQTVDKSGIWTIGYNNSLKGCIASAASQDRTTVWMGFAGSERDAPAYIAFTNPDWRFIEPRKFYEVEIQVAGSPRRKGYGSGVERSNEKGVLVFAVRRQVLEELGERSGLALSVNKGDPAFVNISGSSDAMAKLAACQQGRNVALKTQGSEGPGLSEESPPSDHEAPGTSREAAPLGQAEQRVGEQPARTPPEPRDNTATAQAEPEIPEVDRRQQQVVRQNSGGASAEIEAAEAEHVKTQESEAAARELSEEVGQKPQAEAAGERSAAQTPTPGEKDPQPSGVTRSDKTISAVSPPPSQPPANPVREDGALVKAIKQELTRVGCYDGRIDEDWQTPAASASVQKYARLAGVSISPAGPSNELLESIKGRSERVCPLECGARKVEKNGRCIAKGCPPGFTLDVDGDCVLRRRMVRRHDVEAEERRPRARLHESRPQRRVHADRDSDDDKPPARRGGKPGSIPRGHQPD